MSTTNPNNYYNSEPDTKHNMDDNTEHVWSSLEALRSILGHARELAQFGSSALNPGLRPRTASEFTRCIDS